eukprot:1511499-Pleurochrysis_carterae.AAC.2
MHPHRQALRIRASAYVRLLPCATMPSTFSGDEDYARTKSHAQKHSDACASPQAIQSACAG